MPAPSPELGSAPAAPRCSRLRRAVSALRHDVVAGDAGQGRDERHATGVVLVAGVVEPLAAARKCGGGCVREAPGILPSSLAPRDPTTLSRPAPADAVSAIAVWQGTTLAQAEESDYHPVTRASWSVIRLLVGVRPRSTSSGRPAVDVDLLLAARVPPRADHEVDQRGDEQHDRGPHVEAAARGRRRARRCRCAASRSSRGRAV